MIAKLATQNGIINAEIGIEDGIFTSIRKTSEEAELLMVPGFIDIHTHGGDNIDVNHIGSKEDVEGLSRFYASHGVTSVLLSVMTDTEEKMKELVTAIGSAISSGTAGAEVLGIHLEGPFLSPEYKGAMPESLLRAADWDFLSELIILSGNTIRYITVAPELEGMEGLIRKIRTETGIAIAMGHSSASYECASAAVDNGVRSATHLFNAMKLFHMHRPAISGAALERDEVYAELICDGHHLHPATVRLVARTKGFGRLLAISDSIMAAGLPPGSYRLGVNDVIVGEDGDAKLPDGVRAGSTLTLDRAFRNMLAFTGGSIHEVQKAFAANQANLLHLMDRGRIETGLRADYCLLDRDLAVVETAVRGRTVFRR